MDVNIMDIKPNKLLQRVLRFAREELERRARPGEDAPLDTEQDDAPGPQKALAEPSAVQLLEVVRPHHDGGLLTLRWAVTPAEVARAQTLISGNPVLCVRLVNFTKARDDVLREVQDRPGVELSGHCEIGEPQQRAVVSLGLRSGERFVSIAHHVI